MTSLSKVTLTYKLMGIHSSSPPNVCVFSCVLGRIHTWELILTFPISWHCHAHYVVYSIWEMSCNDCYKSAWEMYSDSVWLRSQHWHVHLFADDTVLYVTVDNPDIAAEEMNDDLLSVSKWSSEWLLTFNPDKRKEMIISRKRQT